MKPSRFLGSVRHALRGVRFALRHEQNFRMQCAVALATLVAAWFFSLPLAYVLTLFIVIFFVLILEMINTSLEVFLDIVKPRLSSQVQAVKDIMAGATLLASALAVIVGASMFWLPITRFLASVAHSGIL